VASGVECCSWTFINSVSRYWLPLIIYFWSTLYQYISLVQCLILSLYCISYEACLHNNNAWRSACSDVDSNSYQPLSRDQHYESHSAVPPVVGIDLARLWSGRFRFFRTHCRLILARDCRVNGCPTACPTAVRTSHRPFRVWECPLMLSVWVEESTLWLLD
jgi:hypothetical protein